MLEPSLANVQTEFPDWKVERVVNSPGEFVYALCLDPPQRLLCVDAPPLEPVSHYVGWTQQTWPMKRVRSHGVGLTWCVLLVPATQADAREIGLTATCPRCGKPFAG
jgi:hypothetical protein